MRPASRATAVPALVVTAALALSACGSSDASSTAAGASTISVKASDSSCEVSKTDLQAGTHTFAITNAGSKTTEVYLYAQGDKIVAEKENIAPGLQYELTAQVPAGSYEVACKPGQVGNGIRTAVTVAAAASTAAVDPAAEQAVSTYRTYVQQQADALVPLVTTFTTAVKAGDVAAAKAAYAPSRVPWEAVEPVAEAFGDLDPLMDTRKADLEPGQEFTGWHRIEEALWTTGSTAGLGPVADQLLTNVKDLQGRVATAELTPVSIANGAKELLDEVATGKITGEEEAFSHTDLVDFAANVAGSKEAYTSVKPMVLQSNPDLASSLDSAFTAVEAGLEPYATAGGYVSYDTVTEDQRRELARLVDALGDPLSQLAATVAR